MMNFTMKLLLIICFLTSCVSEDYDYDYGNESDLVCPGQPQENYCDCTGGCIDEPDWCSCDEAIECCENYAVTVEKEMTDIKKEVIISKVSAVISMIASVYIICDLMRDRRKKLKETKNLVLLLMNVSDMLYTFIYWFLGSWAAPKGLGIHGAVGNKASCEAQGYIGLTFGATTLVYNALLSMVVLLIVRYRWKEPRLSRMRPFLIYVPTIFYAVMNMPVLIMDGYNFNGFVCTFTPSCGRDPTVECDYGEGLDWDNGLYVYAGIIETGTLVLVNIWILYAMVMLYWTVLQVERQMDRYNQEERINRARSKQVGVQGLFYVAAFYLTYLPYYIFVVLYLSNEPDKYNIPQWLTLLDVTARPLQGFWNALVYLRPSYLKYRKDHPDQSLCNIVYTPIRRFTKAGTAPTDN